MSDSTVLIGLGWVSGTPAPSVADGMRTTRLALHSINPLVLDGFGYIAGDTGIAGSGEGAPDTMVPALVRLYRDADGVLVKRTVSAASGAWRFEQLNAAHTYTAIAYYEGYRAVVADGVRPEPMP